jgi:hypothetical protein
MKTQVKALKIKIKSLAAEAKIIRLEEQKVLEYKKFDEALYLSLRGHRIHDVRAEQRASLLAYGFIRGKAYSVLEKPGKDNPVDLVRVQRLVNKFGGLPYQAYVCKDGVLDAWIAGTLTDHPFVVKPRPVAPEPATK